MNCFLYSVVFTFPFETLNETDFAYTLSGPVLVSSRRDNSGAQALAPTVPCVVSHFAFI